MSYCDYVQLDSAHPVHKRYHDEHYGFPIQSDDELFGRLLMEINQAGLSWETILRREEGFRRAYEGFSLKRIAAYGEPDIQRLLADPGVIRHRKKIEAAIHNAQTILALGSFKNWLDQHLGLTKEEWIARFKKTFRFTGPEITGEFLMSCGYLPGAHKADCPILQRIVHTNPPYLTKN